MARSLIPRAKAINGSGTPWDKNNRGDYQCKKGSNFAIDKYGYCCEPAQLFNPATRDYTGVSATPETHVCKPIRALDPVLVKENMVNNGEFLSRLDSTMRYKLVQLSQLERCVNAAHSIPLHYEYDLLKPLDTTKNDDVANIDVTLKHLKLSLDPMGDYGLMTQMGRELDEWIEMFYTPCYGAIYGMNVGTTPETDVSYFMAYPWYSHQECMKLTCLTNTMRWNREYPGGCSPSVLSGKDSGGYSSTATNCAKDTSDLIADSCKYPQSMMDGFQTQNVLCQNELDTQFSVGNVGWFLDNYCNPQLLVTDRRISDAEKGKLNATSTICTPP